MKKDTRVDIEVEKTLRALEGMERAEPKPFFLTRVEGRLRQRETRPVVDNWLIRPVWAVATLGLVFVLNLSAVVYVSRELAQHEEQETVSSTSEWGFDSNVLDW
ncbi:hypothetical protein [Fibrella aquatica]|jgi:hypothetical protein|uniref:hypothetical protein n=1 Tax=Fibrella aquatica TaxID=3242487 RepID=UPI0035214848